MEPVGLIIIFKEDDNMLNITEVKEKAKNWYEEKELEIKVTATFVGVALVSYVVGGKITDLQVEAGLQAMRADGVMKFFDPVTGAELKTTKEAVSMMKNLNK
jgi:hypothetical protein